MDSCDAREGGGVSPPSEVEVVVSGTDAVGSFFTAEFAERAPLEHGSTGWLQPYLDQLRTSLTASHARLRQAQAHAARLA